MGSKIHQLITVYKSWAWVILYVLSFLFPVYPVWFYFGIVGSFMFILIQLILLIDFAHSWNEVWVRNAEEGNSKGWFFGKAGNRSPFEGCSWGSTCTWGVNRECVCLTCLCIGLLFFTIVHYVLAFAAVVLFYLYYTKPDGCTEHKVFISLNLIFCIIVSVVSILPKVQVMIIGYYSCC